MLINEAFNTNGIWEKSNTNIFLHWFWMVSFQVKLKKKILKAILTNANQGEIVRWQVFCFIVLRAQLDNDIIPKKKAF